jgi:hypothetical protein
MSSPVGGYLIAFDEGQRNSFLSEIRGLEDGFTDALSRSDWPVRQWEVCGFMFELGVITHWALARRGDKVVTGKVRVEFVEVCETSIDLKQVQAELENPGQVKVISSRSGSGGAIGVPAWIAMKNVIGRINPESLAALERLEKLKVQSREHINRPGASVVALERDALGMALDTFDSTGKLRPRTLKSWVAPDGTHLTSFLDGLRGVRTIEDQIIAHDAAAFPGVDATRFTAIGAVFRLGNRSLEVFNFNRTRVEHATGADLLYFNQQHDAWTMVQYKAMERNESSSEKQAIYRPDETFDKEISQMNSFREETPDMWTPAEGTKDYRLSGDGFIFKFCSRVQLEVLSEALMPGMYLPREYLIALLNDTDKRGERGGRLVSFKNTERHLTNSLFSDLLRDGWIGTRGVSSTRVADIVRKAIEAGRSVTVARARPEGDEPNPMQTLADINVQF